MEIDIAKITKSDAPAEVREVYRRLKRDFVDDTDRKTWRETRKKNWAAAYPLDTEKGGLWTEAEKQAMILKGQIPIAINDLAKGIQGSCAVVTAKSPGLNFAPVGSSDLYVAELFKRGWDYILNRNGGPMAFYDWVQEAKVGALGCLEVKHDPGKGINGKIVIAEVDPETFYFEKKKKGKRDYSDVSFGKAHLVTKKYALDTYSGITEADLIFDALSKDEDPDAANKPDTVTGKDNYTIDDGGPSKGPTDSMEDEKNVWEIEDWELVKKDAFWLKAQTRPGIFERQAMYKTKAEIEAQGWRIDGKMATRNDGLEIAIIEPCRIETRVQRIIIGKKIISEIENPLGTDSDGEPILSISTIAHDRTLAGYPTCPTTRAYEVSRSRNKRRMQSIYVVSKNIDAPLVMSEGTKWIKDEVHGDWIQQAKDAPFPVSRVLPGTTSAELINMEQRDKDDISDEFDMPEVFRGKIPSGQNNIAGRTVLALQETVGVMSQPFTLTVESAMERIGKAAAALMLKTWPRNVWERLIEPDEVGTWQPDKEKQIGPDGQPVTPEPTAIQQRWISALDRIMGKDGSEPMSMIDLDVKIVSGSTAPTNRMAKAGTAIEMTKAGIYTPEIALEYMDDPLKDKAVESLKRQQEMMAQQEAMKGAMK